MSEQTLQLENIRVNKKKFRKSKQPINLIPVNVDQIVVSDIFKHSGEGYEYFIGYEDKEIVKPLCIILPYLEECKYQIKKIQMSRFINTELDSDSESDSKSDAKLMTKLKSDSDSDNDCKWLQIKMIVTNDYK